MNRYTLLFENAELEENYRKYNYKMKMPIFKKNIYLITFLLVAAVVYHLILGLYLETIVVIFMVAFMLGLLFITHKYHNLFDLACFLFCLSHNLTFLVSQRLNLSIGGVKVMDTYNSGYTAAYIVLSFNLGTQFLYQTSVVLIEVLILIGIKMIDVEKFQAVDLSIAFGGAMAILYLYSMEKIKRIGFSSKINELLWYKNLDSYIEVSIIQSYYDEQTNKFQLLKANSTSQNMLGVSSQIQFLQLIRQTHIYDEERMSQKKTSFPKENVTLEKLIYYKFIQFNVLKYKQFLKQDKILVKYKAHIYQVKMFTYLAEKKMIALLITRQNQMEELQINSLKLHYVEKIQAQENIFTKNTIIHLVGAINQIEQLKINHKIRNTLQFCKYNAYKLETYKFNRDYYLLQNEKMQLTKFNLQILLNQLISLFKFQFLLKRITFSIKLNDQIELLSNYKFLFQIFFTIIEILISEGEKQSSYLKITIIKQKQIALQIPLINFIITTNRIDLAKLNNVKKQGLQGNLLNKFKQIENLNSKQTKLSIEFSVITSLIGKIGPYEKIIYSEQYSSTNLSFSIYQELIESFQPDKKKSLFKE